MVEPVSDFCCQQTETVCHVLWECAFARNVRALVRGRIQKCSKAAKYYFLLFRSMMNKLDLHQLETWTVIAWAMWNALNKFYFRHLHQLQPKAFFDGAAGLLAEYQHLIAAQKKS